MSSYLKEIFSKKHPITIDKNVYKAILLLMYSFESRQKHPQALNTPMLGIYPIFFTTQDTENLFDVVGSNYGDFAATINSVPSNILDTDRLVTSDPYNLFTTWTMYNVVITKHLSLTEKHILNIALTKLLHYKFFTSLVNHNFKHPPNEAIMKATINTLNKRYDIIEHGTWKATIEARCEDLLSTSSIHYNTINKYDNDNGITYLISDTQTRIRNKIKLIVTAFYEMREKGDIMTTFSLNTEIDGDKVLIDQISTYDTMTTDISNQMMNISKWLDTRYIRLVSKEFPNVTQHLFTNFLTAFANRAAMQAKNNTLDKITDTEEGVRYVGSRVLVNTLLQKTYRTCTQSKVDMRNKLAILTKTKNIYASSRVSDTAITDIKNTLADIVDECVNIQRDATKASLRIAFVYYVMLKSFEFL